MKIGSSIITLTLNPSIDHILTVKMLALYEKNILTGKQTFYGGKGINAAFTLGKLGIPATAVGLIGVEDHAGLKEKLAGVGIHSVFTPLDSITRSTYKIMESSTNKDTEFNQVGPCVSKEHLDKLDLTLQKLFNAHTVLAICGSIPEGVPVDYYKSLIGLAKRNGVITCLDTSGEALVQGVQASPDILRINRSELGEIAGHEMASIPEMIGALRSLHHKGIRKIIISLESDGALGLDGEGFWRVRVPHSEIRGLTGAGDAMTAGFLASQSQGRSFADSLRFSCALATASTLKMEPGDFDVADMENILTKTESQEILP